MLSQAEAALPKRSSSGCDDKVPTAQEIVALTPASAASEASVAETLLVNFALKLVQAKGSSTTIIKSSPIALPLSLTISLP